MPLFMFIYSFMMMFGGKREDYPVFLYCVFVVLLWARWGGPDPGPIWDPSGPPCLPIFLQCFDTVCWVIWPAKSHFRYDP